MRLLKQMSEVCDEVVLVTTSPLQADARIQVTPFADVVERENVGQDFLGWKTVLDARLSHGFDEVVLTNDTYVGMLRDPGHMFAEMDGRPVEYWGVTLSDQITRHLQSFFLVMRAPVLQSRAFTEFWRRMRPAATRVEAIYNQEVGLSGALDAAGFVGEPYFRPTAAEEDLAWRRDAWYKRKRRQRDVALGRTGQSIPPIGTPFNPAVAYADAALADGRLPLVKFDTLRYDPYFLGTDHLLTLCEQRFPEMFDGIREFLARTDPAYPLRNLDNRGGAVLSAEEQATIGYHAC
ncbi:rhamnan synthesis F family protein [Aeromicrobium massiliense]|uniref:rhamnan synthesis F family protein n=1 Tax=Aeromicrobium massiliense TaxID=1464554 RepID=UPI000578A4BD|nr:rhamnan synthesis F family protein [Aeromicrobium massiliense]